MSRFLIGCGGTGGHLSPGIALAQVLAARGHQCALLVSTKQIDARLAKKYEHLDFIAMPGAGFSLHPARLARFLSGQVRGLSFASQTIRRFLPDVVIGFGGFTTMALATAARMRPGGPRIVLHEANRVPGRAIRMAARFAARVYLPPGVHRRGLSIGVLRHCGMPVRGELVRQSPARARLALGLEPDRKVLLVCGGSQGAKPLNDWIAAVLPQLAQEGIQVVCLTGPGKGAAGCVEHAGRSGRPVRAQFLPFSDNMATVLSAADLAVARAGAGTIAEFVRMQVPAILVPFPEAADNHQVHNARFFEQQGGGFVLEQSFLGDLAREVLEVMANEWLLRQFRFNLQRLDRDDAAEFIANDLERLLREVLARVRTPSAATA
jgi:UDP-N-acetylglucosamine--N-acetylmuramyl-(pentapeptide) pyrophosphoryl-undecaprenol N-acetylglucosamine transferase